jgi:hypothetical protein
MGVPWRRFVATLHPEFLERAEMETMKIDSITMISIDLINNKEIVWNKVGSHWNDDLLCKKRGFAP